jgi:hypothetical protein
LYSAAIYGLILKNVSDTDKASDILVEVFLEFEKQSRISEKCSEGIFIRLFRILYQLTSKDSEDYLIL